LIFIGDVHGEFKTYLYILYKMQHKGGKKGVDCSCQVGDMGIGFPADSEYRREDVSWTPEIHSYHKYIRGNHDDPSTCNVHPNYLGDWGYLPAPEMFFVSGGYSIDFSRRFQGIDWWHDEELSILEMNKALQSYSSNKPKIVVSHECPLEMKSHFITNEWKLEHDSRTEKLLQNMFTIHQPEYWICGHHHKKVEIDNNGTHFVCLDELISGKIKDCMYEIPNLTWEGYK